MKVITLAVFLVLQMSQAQAPDAFEVASVKPNHSGGSYGMRITSGGRFIATNVTPAMLIRRAFGVEPFQLTGAPAWTDTERFDVDAKTAGSRDISTEELKPLLQTLLADRFALRIHRETKEVPVYSLVVARSGPKLSARTGEETPSLNTDFSPGKATIIARNTTMAAFAKALTRLPGRPVNDDTELTGAFDFRLEWSPDQTGETLGPSLFTAVQEQLGLKLESTKGPVEVVVIDHVEKPSEN